MALRIPGILLVLVFLAAAGETAAQSYPTKPLRIIVPFAAGSGADSNSRFYGDARFQAPGDSRWWSKTARAAAASSRRWRSRMRRPTAIRSCAAPIRRSR